MLLGQVNLIPKVHSILWSTLFFFFFLFKSISLVMNAFICHCLLDNVKLFASFNSNYIFSHTFSLWLAFYHFPLFGNKLGIAHIDINPSGYLSWGKNVKLWLVSCVEFHIDYCHCFSCPLSSKWNTTNLGLSLCFFGVFPFLFLFWNNNR